MSDCTSKRRVLNEGQGSAQSGSGDPMVHPGEEVAVKVQKLMLRLKGSFMTDDGQGVDYTALRQSVLFKEYLDQCQQLSHVDVGKMAESQKKAFFISILTLSVTILVRFLKETI